MAITVSTKSDAAHHGGPTTWQHLTHSAKAVVVRMACRMDRCIRRCKKTIYECYVNGIYMDLYWFISWDISLDLFHGNYFMGYFTNNNMMNIDEYGCVWMRYSPNICFIGNMTIKWWGTQALWRDLDGDTKHFIWVVWMGHTWHWQMKTRGHGPTWIGFSWARSMVGDTKPHQKTTQIWWKAQKCQNLHGGFQKWWLPIAGWLTVENPI